MDAVMQAAAPIDPARRGDFLEDLALELAKCPEVGPGSVYRILRELQHKHFDPPQRAEINNVIGKRVHSRT